MKRNPSKVQEKITPQNWHDLICLSLANHIVKNVAEINAGELLAEERRLWPDYDSQFDDNRKIVDRIAPAIIASGFFEKTRFKGIVLSLNLREPWEQELAPEFSTLKGKLYANGRIRRQDFQHMSASAFSDLKLGLAAEIILTLCADYQLNSEAIRELTQRYPVKRIEHSTIEFKSSLPLLDREGISKLGLTNSELVFARADRYKWAVKFPFDERELGRIGADTLNIFVPIGLLPDLFVQIANASLNAPKAIIQLESSNTEQLSSQHLHVLRHFCNVHRISICRGNFSSLDELRNLSPNLVRLELDLSHSKNPQILENLDHFVSLQSLRLEGLYINLSKFLNLKSLRALMLSGTSIKSLDSISSFTNLQSLVIANSKITDLSALTAFKRLKYLCLSSLPNLESLDEISQLQDLEYLELENLKGVSLLPDVRGLSKLRRIQLRSMQSITDLSPLTAPILQELSLFELKNLTKSGIGTLSGHSKLIGLQTDNKLVEAEFLNIPAKAFPEFRFSAVNSAPDVVSSQTNQNNHREVFGNFEGTKEDKFAERAQELRVHIKMSNEFGDNQDILKCNAIEEFLTGIIEGEFLGLWDAQEIGGEFYSIFFLGADADAMYESLKGRLKGALPSGSYIELEDEDETIVIHRF